MPPVYTIEPGPPSICHRLETFASLKALCGYPRTYRSMTYECPKDAVPCTKCEEIQGDRRRSEINSLTVTQA